MNDRSPELRFVKREFQSSGSFWKLVSLTFRYALYFILNDFSYQPGLMTLLLCNYLAHFMVSHYKRKGNLNLIILKVLRGLVVFETLQKMNKIKMDSENSRN